MRAPFAVQSLALRTVALGGGRRLYACGFVFVEPDNNRDARSLRPARRGDANGFEPFHPSTRRGGRARAAV